MKPSFVTGFRLHQLNPLLKQGALQGGGGGHRHGQPPDAMPRKIQAFAKTIKLEFHQVSRSLSDLQAMPGVQDQVGNYHQEVIR